MNMLTQGEPNGHTGPSEIGPGDLDWSRLIGPMDAAATVFRGVQILDPGPCRACPPPERPNDGDVLVDYLDRLGNARRAACCLGCLAGFLHHLLGDCSELLVWFRSVNSTQISSPDEAVTPGEQSFSDVVPPAQGVSA